MVLVLGEIHPFRLEDQAGVGALSPRLLIGVAEWIPPEPMVATIHGWLDESLAGVAFVAVEADEIAFARRRYWVCISLFSSTQRERGTRTFGKRPERGDDQRA